MSATPLHFLQSPCRGDITQIYGVNPGSYARFGLAGHNGLDIAFDIGTPIYLRIEGVRDGGTAADSIGTCVRAGDHPSLGRHVVIHVNDDRLWEHGYFLLYAHLEDDSCVAGIGVANGWLIGRMGSTGNSTGPHLHFGCYPCTRPFVTDDGDAFRPGFNWLAYIDYGSADRMHGSVDPLPHMVTVPGGMSSDPPGIAPIAVGSGPERAKNGPRRALGQGLLEVRDDDHWLVGVSKAVAARAWKSLLVPALMLSPIVGGDVAQAVICSLAERTEIVQLRDLCRQSPDSRELPANQSAAAKPAQPQWDADPPGQTGTVAGPLNVRACGSTDCSVVNVLPDGTVVAITATAGDWLEIAPGSWVHGRYVDLGARG